ncbi:MAG: saccharopine dehydrogenase C-terminal domain-containing protein [Thermoplasmata archaeon]
MRMLVLGCGMMGKAIAYDLARDRSVAEVICADRDRNQVDSLLARVRSNKISGHRLDVADIASVVSLMRKADAAICALPEGLNVRVARAALRARIHMVDLAYGSHLLDLDAQARKRGIAIVLDCGVAPGITNILAWRGASLLDKVDNVRMICGGLPQDPVPPLMYRITWSTRGLINMYCGKAKIVRKGRVVEVDAMSELERISFPGVGELEAFVTDGLSTLLRTMRGRVENMVEKTARYPGHAEKILAIRDAGLLSPEPVEVDGRKVVPREVAIAVLDELLRLGDEKDITVLRVDVAGTKDGRRVRRRYVMVDRYDERRRLTSMARTTGYTAAVIARMVVQGEIRGVGVLPPEIAVADVYDEFISQLGKRGIEIGEECDAQ